MKFGVLSFILNLIFGGRSNVTCWAGKMFCVYFLTRQEVALSVQEFLNVSNPNLLDVDVGSLQGKTLRRPTTRQDELTGIVIYTVLQTQVGYLWGGAGAALVRSHFIDFFAFSTVQC